MSDHLPTVTELRRTCGACPAQWEGTLNDGRVLYGRYRGGSGYISFMDTMEDLLDSRPVVWYDRMGSNGFEGYMSDRQFMSILRTVANVPESVSPALVWPEDGDAADLADEPLTITYRKPLEAP
jgi:hypothetical protein